MVRGRVEGAGRGVGEPAEDEAGRRSADGRRAADQGGGRLVLDERLMEVGDDLRGRTGELVEEAEERRLDMGGGAVRGRGTRRSARW